MYEINHKNHTCKKRPLKADFHPMGIPKTAGLLGQAVVGSSSGPGQGLLVNTWMGDLPNKQGESEHVKVKARLFLNISSLTSSVSCLSLQEST